ncbi:GtrA family protein [Calditrichota bacterium GD2]
MAPQIKERLIRMIKFGLIGASGLIVNNLFLWIFHGKLHISLEVASPLAIVIAIFNNFSWNDLFTWGRERHKRRYTYFHRLIRYYTSAALGGLINYATLLILTSKFDWPYILSNLIGIGLGMISNFLLSEFWVFRKKSD